MLNAFMKFATTGTLALGLLGGSALVASAQPLDATGSGQCQGQGGCVGDRSLIDRGGRDIIRDREYRRDRSDDRREVRRDRDRDRGENRREWRRDRDRDRRADYRDRRVYRGYDRSYYGGSYYRDPYYGSPSVVFEYSRPAYRQVQPRYVRPGAFSSAHFEWCYDRYRSYRASDNTFQPNRGPRRACYSPYS